MSQSANGDAHSQIPAELRELAKQIQEETDTNKMIELVQQLIAKFDEQRLQRAQFLVQQSADPGA
jgi:molybdopterin converting factor small subunit